MNSRFFSGSLRVLGVTALATALATAAATSLRAATPLPIATPLPCTGLPDNAKACIEPNGIPVLSDIGFTAGYSLVMVAPNQWQLKHGATIVAKIARSSSLTGVDAQTPVIINYLH